MDRILIVEDEGVIALNLESTLQRLGYEVVGTAGTNAEAIRLASSEQPDLVLMDIHLGGGADGIETARQIHIQQNTAVIYLTAYSEEATLKRARATHPYGFLLKPFSDRELHANIQMAIARHRSDLALTLAEERLRLALEAADMGSWELDVGSDRLQRQGQTDEILGLDAMSFDGSWAALLDRVVPEHRAAVDAARSEAVDRGGLMSVDFQGTRDDGSMPWLRLQARRRTRSGESDRLIGVALDITVRRQGEAAVRQAAAVFNSATEAIFITDAELQLLAVNAAFTTVTGHSADEVIGHRVGPWLLRFLPGDMALDLLLEVRKQGRWQGEMTGRRRNGDSFPAWLNMSAVPTEHDEQARVIGIFSDIGALRRAESELLHLAHHDPLTGLPNRLFAMERLEQAISRSRRKLQNTAVIMIDLDHFKHVNDSLGHAAGDELLREVSQRLKSCVRAEDTIARLGGDEFMLILEDIDQSHDVVQIADKLLRRLSEPAILGKSEIRASASLGVSLFPNDAQDSEAMLMASDTAMYAAKAAGRGRVEFYAQDMADRVKRKVRAEQDLRRGVAAGELRVHYQPQIAFADGRLVGAEALVRWQHPDRGLLSAFEVVPLAEESALIVEIGAFVLIEVCRQIRAWLDAGLACPPVAVNVSVHQLRSGRFPEFVARVLAEAGLGADRLELELTESTLQQEDICLPAMRALAQLGVALAIDDFGTGYSSLASLKRFPVSSCKIDRIFVSEIATDVGDAAIAAAIIDLGHRLKMQVIAEGVETETQFEVLRTLGCDRMQGYLIARPMAADDFGQLLLAADAPDKSLPFPRVAAPEKA